VLSIDQRPPLASRRGKGGVPDPSSSSRLGIDWDLGARKECRAGGETGNRGKADRGLSAELSRAADACRGKALEGATERVMRLKTTGVVWVKNGCRRSTTGAGEAVGGGGGEGGGGGGGNGADKVQTGAFLRCPAQRESEVGPSMGRGRGR